MFWMQNMLKVFNIFIQVDLLIFLFIRLFLRILDLNKISTCINLASKVSIKRKNSHETLCFLFLRNKIYDRHTER
jgi:hypothetical protein